MQTKALSTLFVLAALSPAAAQSYRPSDGYESWPGNERGYREYRDRDDGYYEDRYRGGDYSYDRGDDRWTYGGRSVQLVAPSQLQLGRGGHAAARIDPGYGQFQRLRLENRGRPVYIDSVVLHFGNGRRRVVRVDQRLSQDDPMVLIDVPGERRTVRAIEIYGSGRGGSGVAVIGMR